ncbi:hypothetical protein [uncultured Microbulbifer sp.]|uniref:hypothetical protein n=1 Tax=uncultured Microbulbifer sp. TaxID=348147 RepID=UPI00261737D1|nr:hypothetical protein [uncultured Microbulbifer sp.]
MLRLLFGLMLYDRPPQTGRDQHTATLPVTPVIFACYSGRFSLHNLRISDRFTLISLTLGALLLQKCLPAGRDRRD